MESKADVRESKAEVRMASKAEPTVELKADAEAADAKGMEPKIDGKAADAKGMEPKVDGKAADAKDMEPKVDGKAADAKDMEPKVDGKAADAKGMEPKVDGKAADAKVEPECVATLAHGQAVRGIAGSPVSGLIVSAGGRTGAGLVVWYPSPVENALPGSNATRPVVANSAISGTAATAAPQTAQLTVQPQAQPVNTVRMRWLVYHQWQQGERHTPPHSQIELSILIVLDCEQ